MTALRTGEIEVSTDDLNLIISPLVGYALLGLLASVVMLPIGCIFYDSCRGEFGSGHDV